MNLFSRFGVNNPASGGFEVWGLRTPPASPPPAGGVSLSGHVVSEDGMFFVEVPIQLQVWNGSGWDNVGVAKPTDGNGFFEFDNLAAGTYQIVQVSEPVLDGWEHQDGTVPNVPLSGTGVFSDFDPDVFTGIIVDGQTASGTYTGFDFTEIFIRLT